MDESILDTDILPSYFRKDEQVISKVKKYQSQFDLLNISIITFYEILGGLLYKNAQKHVDDFYGFVINNNIIQITTLSTTLSSKIYANLRQKGITIGNSDILIAGMAIENNLTLVTNNEKHFGQIEGLKIKNWKNP